MTIASEISRLQTAKADIKTAIENKGVTVATSALLGDYPGYIDLINTGLQPDSITLNLSSSLTLGDSVTLSVTATFGSTSFTIADTTQVSITSSDTSVVEITTSGTTVTATTLTEGTATITATIGTATSSVTVTVTDSSWAALKRRIKAGTEAVGNIYTDDSTGTKWRVVHIMSDSSTYGGSGAGAILQMTHYVDNVTKAFANATGTQYTEWRGMDSISALRSNNYLRYYMNNGFYNTLSAEFRAVIATASVPTCPNGSTAVYRTSDKLFAASVYEVMGVGDGANYIEGERWTYYKNLISSATNNADSNRIMRNSSDGSADNWWLRSAYRGNTSHAWYVYTNGTLYYASVTYALRVVPACLIA